MDLHIHSNASYTSTASVQDILVKAKKEKCDIISITDHNTALAHVVISLIKSRKFYKGRIISGMEIDVCADGIAFELLAYNFEVNPVQEWIIKAIGTEEDRQIKMRKKLLEIAAAKGFKFDPDFKWNPKAEFAHHNVWRNLKQHRSNDELFGRNIENESDFYKNSIADKSFVLYLDLSLFALNIAEVVKVIHKYNGVVSLAHPFGYTSNVDGFELLKICKQHSVDGVEVYHDKNSPADRQYLLDYAKENNLLISGGSDWHGEPEKPFTNLKNLLKTDKEWRYKH